MPERPSFSFMQIEEDMISSKGYKQSKKENYKIYRDSCHRIITLQYPMLVFRRISAQIYLYLYLLGRVILPTGEDD